MARNPRVFTDNSMMSLWSYDLDELAEAIRYWDLEMTRLSPGMISGQLCQVQLEGLQVIFYGHAGCHVRTRGSAPPHTVAFGIAKNPMARTIWQGYEFNYEQIMVNTNREVDLKAPDDYELFVLTLDQSLLFETADNLCRRNLAKELRHKSIIDAVPGSLDQLRSLLTKLVETSLGSGLDALDLNKTLTTQKQSIQQLILALIEAIPAPDATTQQKRHPFKRTRLAKQVEAYMLDNLENPLSLQELCTMAGTSERSLHYAFHDLFDMSPMAYLKAHRLNQVRRQLKSAVPETQRVIDIARKWGFHHMGHFSVDYKAMFGESPSVTLRRFAG